MKTSHLPATRSTARLIVAIAAAGVSLASSAGAAALVRYDFSTGSVVNSGTSTAAASSVADPLPGLTASTFTAVGGTSNQSISSTTATAYMRMDISPAAADIYTFNRYFTFSVALTSAFSLQSLTFDYGTSSNTVAVDTAYATQIQVGSGEWVNLGVGTATSPINTGTGWVKTGEYTASLTGPAYQNLSNTTLNFRILLADNTNAAYSNRISNVILNGSSIPEPSSLLLGGIGLVALIQRRKR